MTIFFFIGRSQYKNWHHKNYVIASAAPVIAPIENFLIGIFRLTDMKDPIMYCIIIARPMDFITNSFKETSGSFSA